MNPQGAQSRSAFNCASALGHVREEAERVVEMVPHLVRVLTDVVEPGLGRRGAALCVEKTIAEHVRLETLDLGLGRLLVELEREDGNAQPDLLLLGASRLARTLARLAARRGARIHTHTVAFLFD